MRRKLWVDSGWLGAAQAGGQVLAALTYALAARTSSPHSFGAVAAYLALAITVSGAADFGSSTHTLREYSSGRCDNDSFARWWFSRLVTFLAVAVGFASVGLATGHATAGTAAAYALFVVLCGAVLASAVPLRARSQMFAVARAQVSGRFTSLVFAVAVFVGLHASVVWLPTVLSVGMLVECSIYLLGWTTGLRANVVHAASRFSWVNPWRGSRDVGISTTLLSAQLLDTPIVGSQAGAAQAGVYGAVSRWVGPLQLLANAFTQAALPRLAAAKHRRDVTQVLRAGAPLLALGALGSLMVVLLAPVLVPVILGQAYIGSTPVLQILALAVLPPMIAQPIYTVLISQHHERATVVALAIGVPTQLVLVWVFAGVWGAVGGAVAVLIGQTLSTLLLVGAFFVVSKRPGSVLSLQSVE